MFALAAKAAAAQTTSGLVTMPIDAPRPRVESVMAAAFADVGLDTATATVAIQSDERIVTADAVLIQWDMDAPAGGHMIGNLPVREILVCQGAPAGTRNAGRTQISVTTAALASGPTATRVGTQVRGTAEHGPQGQRVERACQSTGKLEALINARITARVAELPSLPPVRVASEATAPEAGTGARTRSGAPSRPSELWFSERSLTAVPEDSARGRPVRPGTMVYGDLYSTTERDTLTLRLTAGEQVSVQLRRVRGGYDEFGLEDPKETGVLRIRARAPDSSTALTFSNFFGRPEAEITNGGGGVGISNSAGILRAPTAGVYQLIVARNEAGNGSPEPYTVSIHPLNPDPEVGPRTLAPGQQISGSIDHLADVDTYTITAATGEYILRFSVDKTSEKLGTSLGHGSMKLDNAANGDVVAGMVVAESSEEQRVQLRSGVRYRLTVNGQDISGYGWRFTGGYKLHLVPVD